MITCQTPDEITKFAIGDEPINIGSSQRCDLVLSPSLGLAPEHAVMWRRGDDLILHVTTFDAACEVNGRPARWASLDDGDTVVIGEAQFTIERRAVPAGAGSETGGEEGAGRE